MSDWRAGSPEARGTAEHRPVVHAEDLPGERADAGPELPAPVAVAVRAHVSAAIAAREWATFVPAVNAKLASLEASVSPDAVQALREAISGEVASRDFAAFTREVMARVEAAIEAELSAPSAAVAALRGDLGAELARRDGAWTAFKTQAGDAIADGRAAEAKLSLPDRAIAELRAEAAAEVEAVAPELEKRMPAAVAKDIAAPPAKVVRITDWLARGKRKWAAAAAGLAAAAAAVFLVIAPEEEKPVGEVERRLAGEVTVDAVEFEGNVTLISGEGAAVIWLADAS